MQESAATALTKLADFNPESSFSAWMSQIVRFTALNHARTTTRRNTHATADLDKGALTCPCGEPVGSKREAWGRTRCAECERVPA